MNYSVASVYLVMKAVFFFSLVKVLVKYEPMERYTLFLGLLYTSGVAFLSYVFLVSWQTLTWAPWQIRVAQAVGVSPWLAWVGETFLLSTLYFRLLVRFEDGVVFWSLLLLGLLLVWF